MKYKMTYRLIGYFSAVLLLFAVAVGGMLMFLLSKQMTEAYEEELKARAVSISETLSAFSRGEGQMPGMESSQGHGHGKGAGSGTAGGYGGYLRFIDDIAMSEVWLVDEKARTIETTHMESALSVGELPENAEAVVEKGISGTGGDQPGIQSCRRCAVGHRRCAGHRWRREYRCGRFAAQPGGGH